MSEEKEQIEKIAMLVDAPAFQGQAAASKDYRRKAARVRAAKILSTVLGWLRTKPTLSFEAQPKTCPFCNEQPEVLELVAPDGYSPATSIRCSTCGIEMVEEYAWEALARWNERKGIAQPSIIRLERAVRSAREAFARYVSSHSAKDTDEGRAKAALNQELVDEMDEALAPVEEAE